MLFRTLNIPPPLELELIPRETSCRRIAISGRCDSRPTTASRPKQSATRHIHAAHSSRPRSHPPWEPLSRNSSPSLSEETVRQNARGFGLDLYHDMAWRLFPPQRTRCSQTTWYFSVSCDVVRFKICMHRLKTMSGNSGE